MKKSIFSLLLLLALLLPGAFFCLPAGAKAPLSAGYTLYRIYLKDKKGTPCSLRHPEQFLSERALQRRSHQGLEVDETDLPVSPVYLSALREAGFTIVSRSKWNNTVVVRFPSATAESAIRLLNFVRDAKRLYTYDGAAAKPTGRSFLKIVEPKDSFTATTGYGKGEAQIRNLNGIRLHEAGFRGQGKLIAIQDAGFMNADSIAYLSNVNIVDTRSFVYPVNNNLYDDTSDHGTMVLSCMAANVPGRLVGTAPEARYVLLRSEYTQAESLAEEDFWAAAAEYADSLGVDVINSSLGYNVFDDKSTNHLYREQDGETALISRTASMLAGKGIILCNSAGNDGGNAWKKINFPADAKEILTVGALANDSTNAVFSSVGPSADGRVKPDVMAYGNPAAVINGRGHITRANGTSFSSPVTAGMVASLWSALPGKTAREIMELVRRSSSRFDAPDNIFGYGIPDYWKAYEMGLQH
ncbi:S8 family serine peptidase [Prevotella sp. kh1p2]|uniref:S8 family serine peptidase n=1 Tax=Prevotella sp. kh1p2 TaxID=1761883 RepID=UPI0008AC3847|nr:S8 family serine peptidase [Prevotella sp. kh1p2]SES73919.1 Subtilase family protein [Prevotella sp. kh1p2]SNU10590.1 Subtilase family protein [Prevotellaceae bacterium KH2P17]